MLVLIIFWELSPVSVSSCEISLQTAMRWCIDIGFGDLHARSAVGSWRDPRTGCMKKADQKGLAVMDPGHEAGVRVEW